MCAHVIKSLSCSLCESDGQVDGAGDLHPGVSKLESSTWTWLTQLAVWSGTFNGITVKTSPPSANRNTEGTEEVLSEGKVCFAPSVVSSTSRPWGPWKFMAGTPRCIVPASIDLRLEIPEAVPFFLIVLDELSFHEFILMIFSSQVNFWPAQQSSPI